MIGWYQVKLYLEQGSGISMDALHVLLGVAIFLIAAAATRRGVGSIVPWSAVLALELANEAYDLHVEVWPNLARQLFEGATDIGLTMALPTLLLLLVRWKPRWILGREAAPSGDPG